MKRILCLLLVCLLLHGCSQEKPQQTLSPGEWERMTALTYGVLESEKLTTLHWGSGRCEATSHNAMAETELGYYISSDSWFYYADKADMTQWVLVCGKPNCNHANRMTCAAATYIPAFVLHEGRIYQEAFGWRYINPARPNSNAGMVLVSMLPNGTDKKFAYELKNTVSTDNGGSATTRLSDESWMYYSENMDVDGTYIVQLVCVDSTGERLLFQERFDQDTLEEIQRLSYSYSFGEMYGDAYYSYPALVPDHLIRVEGEQIRYLDRSLLSPYGGYISGTTLRTFRPNDGYYDINTETGEMVKLTDNRLGDSVGIIALPNCMIESTLFNSEYEGEHAMAVFDGEEWHDVKLPEELKQAVEINTFALEAVTSDRILFRIREADLGGDLSGVRGNLLYSISLESNKWELEYLFRLVNVSE